MDLSLRTLIDQFDINAVQTEFVVDWSDDFKEYYIDHWYKTINFDRFLASCTLNITV